ncbi:cupredoxin domain-containing protein [Ramlibacter humi]|uniref:Nitrous-oxide reductase n=1 Tax=Ramlibacter humi TaxID=2530451 RepID=A0A4Z0BPT0_9BURK|nr:cupredoxin domain-containing protein [Ramlibacter humi]TFZ00065.1 cytochrome c oxidase subunit II [Ramlibacter humi]
MNRIAHRRAFLAYTGALAFAGLAAWTSAAPARRVVPMVARKWTFVPGTVQARKGEVLLFQLTAPEVPMGFSLPDFKVRTDVVPGQPATLELVADKAGSFTYLCDVFCGEGHETMNGTLVVSE